MKEFLTSFRLMGWSVEESLLGDVNVKTMPMRTTTIRSIQPDESALAKDGGA
jgi:hypothetical protein